MGCNLPPLQAVRSFLLYLLLISVIQGVTLNSTAAENTGPLAVLAAGDAKLSGPPVKMEQGSLGHWNSTSTTAEWEIDLADDCELAVELLVAAEEPFAGSDFELKVADSTLKGTVPATTGWHDYQVVPLGTVKAKAGQDASGATGHPFAAWRLWEYPGRATSGRTIERSDASTCN